MSQIFITLIEFYQKYLSFDRGVLMMFAPGGACKSIPSCSEFTKQQIIKNGIIKGLSSGFVKILKCR